MVGGGAFVLRNRISVDYQIDAFSKMSSLDGILATACLIPDSVFYPRCYAAWSLCMQHSKHPHITLQTVVSSEKPRASAPPLDEGL